MNILNALLGSAAPKSPKVKARKARRARPAKRQAAAPRRDSRREMTAAEAVREALLRG